MSLDEAIQHPFFNEIREKFSCKMTSENVKIDFDNEDLDIDELKILFRKEI